MRNNFFRIREFQKQDKEQVLSLFRLNTPESFHPFEEKDLQEYLESVAKHYFVAEDSKCILAAGGFSLGCDSGKTARISYDLVHPEFSGIGNGKN